MITSSHILQADILVVDDKEAHANLLEQVLRGEGYQSVSCTTNSREVCDLFRTHQYALILLDLHMPFMDGYEVIEGLKKLMGCGSYLPVLALTAQPDHKLRVLKAGARDFVTKPFDFSELLVRVHNMLETQIRHRETETRARQSEMRNKELAYSLARLKLSNVCSCGKPFPNWDNN